MAACVLCSSLFETLADPLSFLMLLRRFLLRNPHLAVRHHVSVGRTAREAEAVGPEAHSWWSRSFFSFFFC